MSKRIRFGLNFLGPSPAKDGTFLSELGIRYIEGCDAGDKRYVLFSLDRAKKSTDVLQAIEDYNKKCPTSDLDEELLMASDGMLTSGSSAIVLLSCAQTLVSKSGKPPRPCKVAVFDKGHAFQSHEIFRVIHTAKLALNEVEAPPIPAELFVSPLPSSVRDQPSGYWSWGVAEETSGAKRAVAALVSDLVEQSIKPCASKRVSFAPPGRDEVAESGEEPTGVEDNLSADDAVVVEQQAGSLSTSVAKPRVRTASTTPSSSSHRRTKRQRSEASSSQAIDVMGIMRELSDFARETIEAKDQLIQFLMTHQNGGGCARQ